MKILKSLVATMSPLHRSVFVNINLSPPWDFSWPRKQYSYFHCKYYLIRYGNHVRDIAYENISLWCLRFKWPRDRWCGLALSKRTAVRIMRKVRTESCQRAVGRRKAASTASWHSSKEFDVFCSRKVSVLVFIGLFDPLEAEDYPKLYSRIQPVLRSKHNPSLL